MNYVIIKAKLELKVPSHSNLQVKSTFMNFSFVFIIDPKKTKKKNIVKPIFIK